MTTPRRISAVARRQHRVISLAQLREIGVGKEAVRHLVRKGFLWRVHRGVLALEGPLTPEGRAMAATMRTNGAASHLTAASLTAAVDLRPTQPHVSTDRASGGKPPKGITLHRVRVLEATTFKGIPRRAHDSYVAFTDDRVRDRAHTLQGFHTMRFTWAEVEAREPVERDLVAYFSRR